MKQTRTILQEKVKESVAAVLPVTVIVFLMCFSLTPVTNDALLCFLLGAAMLIFGMGLFTLGAETAMTPMGEYVGAHITAGRKLFRMLFIAFFVGFLITVSEPDLSVLAAQVASIDSTLLIMTIGIGVGLFLAIALLRIFLGIRLQILLLILYALVFALAGVLMYVSPDFLAVAFDSGGVTTGPMTVPFIMALGVGVSSVRSDDGADRDSFGLVALCSVGPILAIMILSLFAGGAAGESSSSDYLASVLDSRMLGQVYLREIPHYMLGIARALAPIVVFFFIYQLLAGRLEKRSLYKIAVGVGYTYVGLVLFLTGANVGFLTMGQMLGEELGTSFKYLAVPIGMLLGYFIVKAEPAVHVLAKQVEDATAGAISGKMLILSLEIGVSASVALAFLRILFGVPFMALAIPGYVIALGLSFFVPPIFTSIAFDAGGVASGPMTASFLLPLAIGLCRATGGNITADAFGVVAMVAMTPLITVQILGVIYRVKANKALEVEECIGVELEEIIDL